MDLMDWLMKHFVLLVQFVVVFSNIQHPHVLPEIHDSRCYKLCLHLSLNGQNKWFTIPKGKLNSSTAAYELLSGDIDQSLKEDFVALESLTGWVETRVITQVLVRLDIRQKLRRSIAAPQLFITTGSCHRVGVVDVLSTSSSDNNQNQNTNSPPPWIHVDYSSFNIDEEDDWSWLFYGRCALHKLAIPLIVLMDMVSQSEDVDIGKKANDISPIQLIGNAIIKILNISQHFFLSNGSVSFEIPYCGDHENHLHKKFPKQQADWLCRFLTNSISNETWHQRKIKHFTPKMMQDDGEDETVLLDGVINQNYHNHDEDTGEVALKRWSQHNQQGYWSMFEVLIKPSLTLPHLRIDQIVEIQDTHNNAQTQSSVFPSSLQGAYVLNLARRDDRWASMQDKWRHLWRWWSNMVDLERIDAVDGSKLFQKSFDINNNDDDEEEQFMNGFNSYQYSRNQLSTLFSLSTNNQTTLPLNPHPDHGWRVSILGCALSHRKVWRKIASAAFGSQVINSEFFGDKLSEYDKEDFNEGKSSSSLNKTKTWTPVHHYQNLYDAYLVLEDDVEFSPDFATRFSETIEAASSNHAWDIIFLGALDDRDFYEDLPAYWSCSSTSSSRLNCLLSDLSSNGRVFGSGLFGYIIRPRAAYALLKASVLSPIRQPIDWWVWEKLTDQVHVRDLARISGLKANPPLATSPEGEGRDSDNDEDYSSLRFLDLAEDQIDDDEEMFPATSLIITYPPPLSKPFFLACEEAVQGGRVNIEIDSMNGKINEKLWYEAHKIDLLCLQVAHIQDKTDDDEEVQIHSDSFFRKCRPLNDATMKLPSIRKAGLYSVRSFLISSNVDHVLENAKHQFMNKENHQLLVQTKERTLFYVSETNDEETVPIEVSIDGQSETLQWKPSSKSVYDEARHFCVNRLLLQPQPASNCMDSLITALLEIRRKSRGYS